MDVPLKAMHQTKSRSALSLETTIEIGVSLKESTNSHWECPLRQAPSVHLEKGEYQ